MWLYHMFRVLGTIVSVLNTTRGCDLCMRFAQGCSLAGLLATTTTEIFSVVKPPVTVGARILERCFEKNKPQMNWPSLRQEISVGPEHVHPLKEVVAYKTFSVVVST